LNKARTAGWFGQVEEVPAAMSQGRTIEELEENLLDALKMALDNPDLQYLYLFA